MKIQLMTSPRLLMSQLKKASLDRFEKEFEIQFYLLFIFNINKNLSSLFLLVESFWVFNDK